jgi:predicted adenylyl cyclase CyaB
MEVESKVRLTDAEVSQLLERLTELGVKLGPAQLQRDVYYKEAGFRGKIQGTDGYILRIRYSGERSTLNMKRLTTEEGVWTEVETQVADGHAVEKIIKTIGLEHAVNVTKDRRSGETDGLEVVIDDIEELGTFLELAVEGDELDVATARQKINTFLSKLGIAEDRVEYRGYPTILLEQQGVVFSLK